MEIIEELTCFGLTRQEAAIYLALLTDGEVTGYEAAKLTGISRSNSYNALAGLVEKGAAYIIEGTVTKYTPVQLEEFCENKLRGMRDIKHRLLCEMPEKREETQGYITIKSERHIFDKMRNMLLEAEKRVYIFLSRENLDKVKEELEFLLHKGIKLVIITEEPYYLLGATVYYREKVDSQIRLIVDSAKVLTGEAADKEDSTCLYSKNKNLVDVFKEMLKNEIKLIELTQR